MKLPRKKFLKYVQIFFAGILVGPYLIFLHIFFTSRYAKNPQKYPIEKRWKKIHNFVVYLCKVLRIKIVVKGYEEYLAQPDKCVLIINHQAVFDPIILMAASERPMCFVAKKEVYKYPFAGKILRAVDGVFLDREHLMSQMATIREMVNKAKNPNVGDMGIYIEGHRNEHIEGPVQEYKAGTVKVCYMIKQNIVLLASYGTWRILSPRYHLGHYMCYVNYAKIYKPEDYKGRNNFEMAKELEDLANVEIDKIREMDIEHYTNSHETRWAKRDAMLISKKTPIKLKGEE